MSCDNLAGIHLPARRIRLRHYDTRGRTRQRCTPCFGHDLLRGGRLSLVIHPAQNRGHGLGRFDVRNIPLSFVSHGIKPSFQEFKKSHAVFFFRLHN
jgi:hypothetical protein